MFSVKVLILNQLPLPLLLTCLHVASSHQSAELPEQTPGLQQGHGYSRIKYHCPRIQRSMRPTTEQLHGLTWPTLCQWSLKRRWAITINFYQFLGFWTHWTHWKSFRARQQGMTARALAEKPSNTLATLPIPRRWIAFVFHAGRGGSKAMFSLAVFSSGKPKT